jgi:hypothetical protein
MNRDKLFANWRKVAGFTLALSVCFLILISGCAGSQATGNEMWTLVKIITQGEDIQSNTDTVIVRNCCGLVESKTVSCSAGTSSDLSVEIGGSFGNLSPVSFEPSVGTALGFNRNSGESLELPIPPSDYYYVYQITKIYSIIAGEAIARSSSGQEKRTSYRFQAKCSLKIEPNRDSLPCNESCNSQSQPETSLLPGNDTPMHLSTATNLFPTPSPLPASSPPRIKNFSACLKPCTGGNSTRSFPEAVTKLYAQWDYENIPRGAKYVRKWTMNGNEWIKYDCIWTGQTNGHDAVTLTEPQGLHSGIWEVTIIVNGVILLQEQIKVTGNWTYWDPAGTLNNCYGKTD